MRMTRPVLAGATLVLALLVGVTASARTLETFKHSETRTLDVGAAPHVVIEAISGDVSYRGQDGATAQIEVAIDVRAKTEAEAADIRAHLKLYIESENGFLDVRMEDTREFYEWLRDEYGRDYAATVSFHVTGPRGAEGTLSSVSGWVEATDLAGPVEATSVSGDVTVTGVQKTVRASSTSGNVDVRRAGAAVFAESVSGDVGVSDCGGDLDLESTSGSVKARGAGGTVTAQTVSGDIEVLEASLDVDAESISGMIWVETQDGEVRASTTSGDITISSPTDGDIDVQSVSGSVRLSIEPKAFGDVSLSSPSGEIDTAVPMQVSHKTRRRLEGRLGDGTAVLRVSTNSGDITISAL